MKIIFDVDLSDYRYEIDENKIAHLYEYIGTKNIVKNIKNIIAKNSHKLGIKKINISI